MSRPYSILWDPQLDPTVHSAVGRYLVDLPVPPELERALHDCWKRCGPMSSLERTFHEEELKMQYHFSDRAVLYIQTTRGRAIIASGPPDLEEVGRVLDALPRTLRLRTTLYVLDRWAERATPEDDSAA